MKDSTSRTGRTVRGLGALAAALLLLLAPAGTTMGAEEIETATFAGGCFWCMEPPFEKLDGVKDVVSGYTGGREENPTYRQVSTAKTDHLEAVAVHYDPAVVSYTELLSVFWRQIDPTDGGGQFVDRGPQYLSAIFTHGQEQRTLAEQSLEEMERSEVFDGPIVTEIRPAGAFWRAEEYHQDYYKKSPLKYKFYRRGSGRDRFLKSIWGEMEMKSEAGTKEDWRKFTKPPEEELRKVLTPIQYRVTRQDDTEEPFQNEYHNSKKAGIYVDIVSREPLFSSHEKYDSETGWPSFYRPLEPGNIVEKTDRKLFVVRTEVRSRHGDSHLGHVFKDGQATGLRYCINSAALRFVPKEDLEKEGYGEYVSLFR